jgi:flagellar biosynthesis chaperone FliJ
MEENHYFKSWQVVTEVQVERMTRLDNIDDVVTLHSWDDVDDLLLVRKDKSWVATCVDVVLAPVTDRLHNMDQRVAAVEDYASRLREDLTVDVNALTTKVDNIDTAVTAVTEHKQELRKELHTLELFLRQQVIDAKQGVLAVDQIVSKQSSVISDTSQQVASVKETLTEIRAAMDVTVADINARLEDMNDTIGNQVDNLAWLYKEIELLKKQSNVKLFVIAGSAWVGVILSFLFHN